MWIAVRPFRYRGTTYKSGDTVPAEGWSNRRALIATRRIRQVESESPSAGIANSTLQSTPSLEWKRDELDAYAAHLGLNTTDKGVYSNKQSVLDAIEERLSSPSGTTDSTATNSDTTDSAEGEDDEDDDIDFIDPDEVKTDTA